MLGDSWWLLRFWEMQPGLAIGWAFWVVASITLHELAHGWAAIREGDDTPIRTGHMTWNPVVHMGPTSLLMFALVGIAWGLMPVDPSRFRSRHGDAIVAFAGPLMNISLAIALAVACAAWGTFMGGRVPALAVNDQLYRNVTAFLFAGSALNFALAAFNLLPVPPLDGSRILASFVPSAGRIWEGERAMMLALFAFAGVFFFVGPRIYGYAFSTAGTVIGGIRRLLFS